MIQAAQLAASLMELAIKNVTSEAELAKLVPLLEQLRSVDFEKVQRSMGVAGTPEQIRERFAHIERDFNPGRVIAWFNYGGLVSHSHAKQSMTLFAKTML